VRAEDDKVHTTDLPQEQQASWSGCEKDLVQEACEEDLVQEACEKDLVQKAFDLLEETINQLDNVSHQRDTLGFQVGFHLIHVVTYITFSLQCTYTKPYPPTVFN
jgi:hypothetical protein